MEGTWRRVRRDVILTSYYVHATDYRELLLTESLRLPSEVGISFHFHFMCEEAECREMGPRHTSPVFPGYGTSLGLQGRIQSKVVCPQGWEAAHL